MSSKEALLDLVRQIPARRATNYGTLAKALGLTPKVVGFPLSGLKIDDDQQIPWWRVVAKNGYISSIKLGPKGLLQEELLRQEGFQITEHSIDLQSHFWAPETEN